MNLVFKGIQNNHYESTTMLSFKTYYNNTKISLKPNKKYSRSIKIASNCPLKRNALIFDQKFGIKKIAYVSLQAG